MMKIDIPVGTGTATITGAELIISPERFTLSEAQGLADWLEGFNVPGNQGTALRRLTDMFWALTNDTEAFIVTTDREP